MNKEAEILENSRVIAVVGLSSNPERPSNRVAQYLMDNGFTVIPVNPNEQEILGQACFPDLTSIPRKVDMVDIFRKSADVPPIVDEAVKIGAAVVWMQEGVVNEEAAAVARKAGLEVVMDQCTRKVHIEAHGGDPEA